MLGNSPVSVFFKSDPALIMPPNNAGGVVGRDLAVFMLAPAGHIGLWDGGKVIEMLQDGGGGVRINTFENFKSRSKPWQSINVKLSPTHAVTLAEGPPATQCQYKLASRLFAELCKYILSVLTTLWEHDRKSQSPVFSIEPVRGIFRQNEGYIDVTHLYWTPSQSRSRDLMQALPIIRIGLLSANPQAGQTKYIVFILALFCHP